MSDRSSLQKLVRGSTQKITVIQRLRINFLFGGSIMKVEELRKEALLWGIMNGAEPIVDRLLDLGFEAPEVSGDFHITVNGIPACVVDSAFSNWNYVPVCHHESLHHSVLYRKSIKAAFPAAMVAIVSGSCPHRCAMHEAA
jgi:hypothetical protein